MWTGNSESRAKGFLPAWVIFFLIWLAASASYEPAALLVGLVVTAGIARIACARTNFWAGFDASPRRLLPGLRFILVFLREMLRSNLAVLGYVYTPRLRIAPVVARLPVRLSGRRERLVLTSAITLTPGTVLIDMEGDALEVLMLSDGFIAGTEATLRDLESVLEKAIG